MLDQLGCVGLSCMCFLDSGMSVGIDPEVDVWCQRSGSKEDSWALALLTLIVCLHLCVRHY